MRTKTNEMHIDVENNKTAIKKCVFQDVFGYELEIIKKNVMTQSKSTLAQGLDKKTVATTEKKKNSP